MQPLVGFFRKVSDSCGTRWEETPVQEDQKVFIVGFGCFVCDEIVFLGLYAADSWTQDEINWLMVEQHEKQARVVLERTEGKILMFCLRGGPERMPDAEAERKYRDLCDMKAG